MGINRHDRSLEWFEMEIEVSLPQSLFPNGLEMLINGDLYTVQYTKIVDDDPNRIRVYLKRES
jgi:hypothetical protein